MLSARAVAQEAAQGNVVAAVKALPPAGAAAADNDGQAALAVTRMAAAAEVESDGLNQQDSGVPNDWEMFMNWEEGVAGGGSVSAAAPAFATVHSNSHGSNHTSMMSVSSLAASSSNSAGTRAEGVTGAAPGTPLHLSAPPPSCSITTSHFAFRARRLP